MSNGRAGRGVQVWMVVGAAISILLAVSVPGVAASYCTSEKPICPVPKPSVSPAVAVKALSKESLLVPAHQGAPPQQHGGTNSRKRDSSALRLPMTPTYADSYENILDGIPRRIPPGSQADTPEETQHQQAALLDALMFAARKRHSTSRGRRLQHAQTRGHFAVDRGYARSLLAGSSPGARPSPPSANMPGSQTKGTPSPPSMPSAPMVLPPRSQALKAASPLPASNQPRTPAAVFSPPLRKQLEPCSPVALPNTTASTTSINWPTACPSPLPVGPAIVQALPIANTTLPVPGNSTPPPPSTPPPSTSAPPPWPRVLPPVPPTWDPKLQYLRSTRIAVGVATRAYGGTIRHLSSPTLPKNWANVNLVNTWDCGRLIQQSYYGCPDGSCWYRTPWIWNPVQCGSWEDRQSRLLTARLPVERTSATKLTTAEAVVATSVVPRNWGGQQLLPEVRMDNEFRLLNTNSWDSAKQTIVSTPPGEEDAIHVKFSMTYSGNATHPIRNQEVPAVFVHRRLGMLVTYTGSKPWTGGNLTYLWPGDTKKPARQYPKEAWAAWVDGSTGYGMAVYTPIATFLTSYRVGPDNSTAASDTSYVALVANMAIQPGFNVSYDTYILTGRIDRMRQAIYRIRALRAAQEAAAKQPQPLPMRPDQSTPPRTNQTQQASPPAYSPQPALLPNGALQQNTTLPRQQAQAPTLPTVLGPPTAQQQSLDILLNVLGARPAAG